MKRLLALLATLISLSAAAQVPQPPEVAARQYLLLDVSSGQLLAERDADAKADPASLTKLMTAYVVFGALKEKRLTLEQTLPVSVRAWEQRKGDPSLMFIDTTMSPKVDELLHGMIVQSGNDASVALAEGVAGSVENFVALMNKQAQAWGLKNTQFRNVTGMTESGHHSSARDLSVIASRLIQDFPQFYGYYKVREYTYNKIRQGNRNLLLARDPAFDGLKTGYTEAAGYCLIASSQREFPNGKRRLLSVVLGTASMEARANESQKLHNWGYGAWDGLRLYQGRQAGDRGAGVEGRGEDGGARRGAGCLHHRAAWRGGEAADRAAAPRPVAGAAAGGQAGRPAAREERRRHAVEGSAAGGADCGARGRRVRPALGCDPSLDQVRKSPW